MSAPRETSSAQVVRLPSSAANQAALVAPNPDGGSEVSLELAQEVFQLQVRLDIERERELLYKAGLVVETLVFLFIVRELLLRWLA
jgi:hypothetical protein